MKLIRLLTLWTALGLAGCTTPHTDTTDSTAPGMNITYSVYGMDCPGCHGGLEKNLEKIPGVIDAVANWKQQTVTLRLDGSDGATHEQIIQAVQDSNFTLGEPVL